MQLYAHKAMKRAKGQKPRTPSATENKTTIWRYRTATANGFRNYPSRRLHCWTRYII